MKSKKFLAVLIFSFFNVLIYGQIQLNEFVTVKLIDSVKYANGWGNLGYKNVHLVSSGNTVYMTAKKIWVEDGRDTATIFFGKRINGNWVISDIHSPNEKEFISNIQITLDSQNNPIIFYKDRTYEDGWQKDGVINVLHYQNNNWNNYTAVLFENAVDAGENFEAYGTEANQGFALLERYWSDVQEKYYMEYSIYDFQTNTLHSAVTYNLDSLTQYYDNFTFPAITDDGEYFVHSCSVPISTGYGYNIGLFVYRRVSLDNWTLDFKYLSRDTLYSPWPYLYTFAYSIGKNSNGDVYLLAKNEYENPFFVKSNGVWTKVEDDYPVAQSFNDSSGASGRGLDDEIVQFSPDGTAFWGDFDGLVCCTYSAETSFKTPNNFWGRINWPPAPGYEWGNCGFYSHDFTITSDDSIIFVYEFNPYDLENTIYLLEAKIYIPDIINYVNAVKPTDNFVTNSFTLFQNYPNPFNPTTTINYVIPAIWRRDAINRVSTSGSDGAVQVSLKVYDALGREVATLVNKKQTPGKYSVQFNASNLPSGVYFYTLRAGDFVQTRKMVLLK